MSAMPCEVDGSVLHIFLYMSQRVSIDSCNSSVMSWHSWEDLRTCVASSIPVARETGLGQATKDAM
jgi:hypothetical protein